MSRQLLAFKRGPTVEGRLDDLSFEITDDRVHLAIGDLEGIRTAGFSWDEWRDFGRPRRARDRMDRRRTPLRTRAARATRARSHERKHAAEQVLRTLLPHRATRSSYSIGTGS